MEKLNQILAIIFYLIWIPLGLLLLAGIVFLIVVNPFSGLMQMMEGDGSGGDSIPSKEMMEQFMQQDGPPGQ